MTYVTFFGNQYRCSSCETTSDHQYITYWIAMANKNELRQSNGNLQMIKINVVQFNMFLSSYVDGCCQQYSHHTGVHISQFYGLFTQQTSLRFDNINKIFVNFKYLNIYFETLFAMNYLVVNKLKVFKTFEKLTLIFCKSQHVFRLFSFVQRFEQVKNQRMFRKLRFLSIVLF